MKPEMVAQTFFMISSARNGIVEALLYTRECLTQGDDPTMEALKESLLEIVQHLDAATHAYIDGLHDRVTVMPSLHTILQEREAGEETGL